MCPWDLEMVTQFAHPASRVSSHTVFSHQICLSLLRGSGVTSLFPRCLNPPRMLKNFLLRKRSFADGWLLAFVPLGNTLYQTPQPWCPTMVIWAESYHLSITQDKVCLEWTQTMSTLPYSAAKSWAVRCLPKVKCLPTLFLGDNATYHLTLWSCLLGGHPIPASWW